MGTCLTRLDSVLEELLHLLRRHPADLERRVSRVLEGELVAPLIARGRPRSGARRPGVHRLSRDLFAGTGDGDAALRRSAWALVQGALEAAERVVLRDLDPLVDMALLGFAEPRWDFTLRDVNRLAFDLLSARDRPVAGRHEWMLDFWAFESSTAYVSTERTYLQELERALRETGRAGGLVRVHAGYFRSSREARSLQSLEELADRGCELAGSAFADRDPDELASVVLQWIRRAGDPFNEWEATVKSALRSTERRDRARVLMSRHTDLIQRARAGSSRGAADLVYWILEQLGARRAYSIVVGVWLLAAAQMFGVGVDAHAVPQ